MRTGSFLDSIRLDGQYIQRGHYLNPGHRAHGAINNVTGFPTRVVPRENGLAILQLIETSRQFNDPGPLVRAELAADFLVRIQDTDGGR